ncbi:hypothetical protein [Metabacillus sp. RGM 3146]|uniref:YkvI family membrane protein n=1 Tax=Metabacillus sp. RGM 3146 TaxID=3401092 RepID=UPI003B9BAA13
MRQNFFKVLQVAFVYVGTVVGAGFATGREIVEFFTKFGPAGTFGIVIAGILFAVLGTKMMVISSRIGAVSFKDFNLFLFGKWAGSFVNVIMLVLLLGVTSVMLSGGGAIFEERLHLPSQIGLIVTAGLTMIVMMRGVKGLVGVNMLVVPMLLLLSLVVTVSSFWGNQLSFILDKQNIISINWIFSSICYAAYNLALSQAVLVPLAAEVRDEKILKYGGILGGIILTFIMLGSHFALLMLPDVLAYDIPMAEVMKTVFSAAYYIYVLVIFGEVFTSVIGNLYGMEKLVLHYMKLPGMVIVCGILAAAYAISLFGYGRLISSIYPFLGLITLIFLIFLIFKKTPIN